MRTKRTNAERHRRNERQRILTHICAMEETLQAWSLADTDMARRILREVCRQIRNGAHR